MHLVRITCLCLAVVLLAGCAGINPPAVFPSPTAANTALASNSPRPDGAATGTPGLSASVTAPAATATFLATALPAATQLLAATDYTVLAGDTIWSIAQHFGVTLQRLIDANPTIDPNLLHTGDVIHIPGPKDVVPTPATSSAEVRVDGGGLRLRATPTLTGQVLGYLDALTRLNVVGRTADSTWLKVVTPTGQGGWVTTSWTDVYVALAKVPIVNVELAAPATAIVASAAAPTAPTNAAPTDAAATTVAGPPPAPNPNGYNLVSGIDAHARQIFLQGQQMGNRANVFSKVGDSITVSPVFLSPIGNGYYNLRDYAALQPVIDFFAAQPARGEANSFNNTSIAAKVGWRALAEMIPGTADPTLCQADEGPLACEYRLVKPSVALIMLGTNDVVSTSDDKFEADMRKVLDLTIARGIVPVLSTIPSLFRTGLDGRAEQLNVIIVKLAREYDIPLWDYWSALQGLPNSGLGGDGVHPTAAPAGHSSADFTPENLQYGMVVRNLGALYALDDVWRQVIKP
jgi:LysM repeat protein